MRFGKIFDGFDEFFAGKNKGANMSKKNVKNSMQKKKPGQKLMQTLSSKKENDNSKMGWAHLGTRVEVLKFVSFFFVALSLAFRPEHSWVYFRPPILAIDFWIDFSN